MSVSGDSSLTANGNEIVDLDRARNADLSSDRAVPTDADIVSDLDEVVDAGSRPDHT